MDKEVIKITRLPGLPDVWLVRYRARNGLIYWKQLKAKDEMDAFMQVMGIRK